MTALRDLIIAQIRATGPLPLSDYMQLCLLHPKHGYYTNRQAIGAAGDFTTAPEISQMFGELLGLALAQSWLDQGAPAPFTLAEAGPGRGTLMADALRATRSVPGFHTALSLHLVEASPVLRAAQQAALQGYPVTFHDDLSALPASPLFLIANEFFDALPIRQFIRDGDGWRERVVGLEDGALAFGLGGRMMVPDLQDRLEDTSDGDVVELCQPARTAAAMIGDHIAQHGGVALIVDYGAARSNGDTFQAVAAHERADPLANPGQADLTAHVDFGALAQATPSASSALTPQGVLLERLGITARAQALAAKLQGEALKSHIAAHRRLTHPQEMGTLFQALAFYRQGTPPPPGFDP